MFLKIFRSFVHSTHFFFNAVKRDYNEDHWTSERSIPVRDVGTGMCGGVTPSNFRNLTEFMQNWVITPSRSGNF